MSGKDRRNLINYGNKSRLDEFYVNLTVVWKWSSFLWMHRYNDRSLILLLGTTYCWAVFFCIMRSAKRCFSFALYLHWKKKRKQQPGLQCILLTCTFDAGNMTLKSLIREAGFLAEGSSSTASCCYFLMQMVIFLLWASKTCSIACSPFHTSQLSGAAPQGLPAQQTPGVNITA